MGKEPDPGAGGERLVTWLYLAVGVLLFLAVETNGAILIMRRQELQLYPQGFVYFIPLLIALPFLAGLVAYKRLSGGGLDRLVVQRALLELVVIGYAVLATIMGVLMDALWMRVNK